MKDRKIGTLNRIFDGLKDSLVVKIFRSLVSSAAVALVITLVIFIVEQKGDAERTDKLVENLHTISDNLLGVQNSVSTRYLGIFPDYLSEVNDLLSNVHQKDSVIIFEDVLYYGILSKPENFIRMNQQLLSHADRGGSVTIAYYDVEGRIFHRMIREQRILPEYFADMDDELRLQRNRKGAGPIDDMEICEKYFRLTREKSPEALRQNVDKYLKPLSVYDLGTDAISIELKDLLARMDSVKTHWLAKDKKRILFSDYENMYRGLSKELISVYKSHGIELIPLNEYLTMTCWLVDDQAVLAFPSKYATEEIGFYSKDPAFSEYIKTMLRGVKGQL